ncbi:MAG: MerR family transcriptional regulator [Oscillospiraceae bacterium]|nr:MerR family transcriptional regulator [Oscillospiraceae bacterium]
MYYSIGTFSKLTRTTVAALRFYDREGIFRPAYTDKNTGYRYYLSSQLSELQEIISLRQIGMSVEQIKDILTHGGKNEQLDIYRRELESRIAELNMQLNRLKLMQNSSAPYEVTIVELEEQLVFSRSATIENNRQIYRFIQDTEQEFFTQYPKLKTASPDYCFLTYLDNEYRSENMMVEYNMALAPCNVKPDGDLFKLLPACKAACIYFKGSNKYIGAGFAFLYDWIIKSGYTVCGNPRERYIDGLWNVDSVDKWLTEIQIPIG